MFKKKTIKKPQAMRRRRTDSVEDEKDQADTNDDDAATTAQKIAQTRKKRKLLTAVQYKQGVDAADLLKRQTVQVAQSSKDAAGASKVKTAAETSRDGALERKHRQAMEAYIHDRMKGPETSSSSDAKETNSATSKKTLTEEALYMDLAAQSAKLTGKGLAGADDGHNNDDDAVEEERGAVLVAGTGIAEVILPEKERVQVARATQAAQAAARKGSFKKSSSSTFRPKTTSAGVPNRFAVASSLTHQQSHQHFHTAKDTPSSGSHTANQSTTTGGEHTAVAADDDPSRPGFAAMRKPSRAGAGGGATQAGGRKPRRIEQASDHKVYTKFVTRQREMRK